MKPIGRVRTQWPALVLAVLIIASGAISSFSGAFIYNKVNLTAQVSKPPLVIWKPQHGQLTYRLGPNQTSIETNVTLLSQAQLLNNPEFQENPDWWFCVKSSSIFSCRFLPSDTGARGGVEQIYGVGYLSSGNDYIAGVAQYFLSPDNASSVSVSVRYSAPSLPSGALSLLVVAVLWWNGSGWQNIGQTYSFLLTSRTYTYYNTTIYLSSPLKPLNFYVILGAVYMRVYSSGFSVLDFRFDSMRLNMTPTHTPIAFAGEVLRLNSTLPEHTHIRIGQVNSSGNVNADIYFENNSVITLIAAIRNGNLVYYNPRTLIINPTGDNMNASGRLLITANATQTGVYLEIRGVIYYTNGVYHVMYPYTIRVSG